MRIGNIWSVFQFEWRRATTLPRIAWWLALVAFPVFVVAMIRMAPDQVPREPWAVFLFVLLPTLIAMLGTFLWTTPAVSSELERQSWVYLAVRPGGRSAVLLGKYLAAVTWVLPAAIISLTICIPIASGVNSWEPSTVDRMGDAWRFWLTMVSLIALACPAYAAVYLVIGALCERRSMVIAVVYTLVFEIIVSTVPAIVNKLTIQHRLRALLVAWADIDVRGADRFISSELLGNAPPSIHVAVLVLYTIAMLAIAIWVVQRREYVNGTDPG